MKRFIGNDISSLDETGKVKRSNYFLHTQSKESGAGDLYLAQLDGDLTVER